MGLYVHSLGEIPTGAERAYYVYLLDYGWEERRRVCSPTAGKGRPAEDPPAVIVFEQGIPGHICRVLKYGRIRRRLRCQIVISILVLAHDIEKKRADHFGEAVLRHGLHAPGNAFLRFLGPTHGEKEGHIPEMPASHPVQGSARHRTPSRLYPMQSGSNGGHRQPHAPARADR